MIGPLPALVRRDSLDEVVVASRDCVVPVLGASALLELLLIGRLLGLFLVQLLGILFQSTGGTSEYKQI